MTAWWRQKPWSRDLRIITVMVVAIAVFGILDGSLWRTLLTPTIAYRPAILFALTLVFGWRGFLWSQVLFLLSFRAFLGWGGMLFVTPLYLLSHALGLFAAQRFAQGQDWLSRERSTLAFLVGAALAPAIPALVGKPMLGMVGITLGPGVPAALDSWLRGLAGIVTLAPALLMYCSRPLRRWVAMPSDREWQQPITARNVVDLGVEVAVWTATLWISVHFKARYGINVTYLTFLAPLAFTLFRGMALATLALAANGVVATTLWHQLHWADTLSPVDLRLLLAIYSITILLLAAVVDERQRGRVQVARLLSAESALRQSEERFRRVFEEGPLGLAIVGKGYRFLKVNSALCQMLDYDEAELGQMSFVDITHQDDVRTDVELAEQLFKGEIPFYRLQKRYLKKNCETIWINLTASVIHGPHGEPLHGIAMVEDITEIKRNQEEALFRQKLESVGTLAGGIAHDFNNLLGAVQSQAELALAELEAGSSCNTELEAIREVTMRGSEIVRQLMIYAGKESEVAGLADLSKVVDEMLTLLKISVTKRAVIKANLDQNLPAVPASAAQIRQIVMNLIINASDAIGDRDGVIGVTTKRVTLKGDSTTLSSKTLADGEYARLDVSDTGCGIPAQIQANVFDPFFTTKSAGRGLGLAVVQGIVRSLGGTIHFVSEPGKGTAFHVLLPCAATTTGANSDAVCGSAELAVPPKYGTLLVVEDEGHLRQAVVKMLRKHGFEVFDAADGTAAINLLRADRRKIDVILLDMTLPGATSHEVVVEAASTRPDIKVIVTSAYSEEIVSGAMNAPQIRGFIRKPFQLNDLLKVLRSALSA